MRLFSILLVTTLALVFAPAAEAAPKVAVVDLVQAIQEHPSTKKVEDRLRKAQVDAKAAAERTQKEIDRLKAELDQIEEINPARASKEKRVLQLTNNLKFNAEWAQLVALREYTRSLQSIYRAVQGEVGRVAAERGHDIVLLKTDPLRELKSSNPEDFALKSRLRVVVYASPSVDITAEVIKRLKASKAPGK